MVELAECSEVKVELQGRWDFSDFQIKARCVYKVGKSGGESGENENEMDTCNDNSSFVSSLQHLNILIPEANSIPTARSGQW